MCRVRMVHGIAGAGVRCVWAFALACVWSIGSAQSTEKFEFGVGIHLGMNLSSLRTTTERFIPGPFSSFRDEVFWSRVEMSANQLVFPTSLADLDTLVSRASAAGKSPIILLGYGNPAYDSGDLITTDAGRAAFLRYVTLVVRHFRNRVARFEVWNEWNIAMGSPKVPRGQGRADDYVRLLKATYELIKKEDASLTVIGGAVNRSDDRWIDAFASAGGFRYLDAFSVHPYVYADVSRAPLPPVLNELSKVSLIKTAAQTSLQASSAPILPRTPESAIAWLELLNDKIKRVEPTRSIPIYVTEIGWPTFIGSEGTSEALAAAYLQRFFLLAKTKPWIAGVYWYDLFDDGDNAAEREHRYGLLKRDGTPKPAFQSMMDIQEILKSPDRPVMSIAASGQIMISGRAAGEPFLATWFPANNLAYFRPWAQDFSVMQDAFRSPGASASSEVRVTAVPSLRFDP